MPRKAQPTSKRSSVSRRKPVQSKQRWIEVPPPASRKSKTTVHESGDWTVERNEAFQREFSIYKNGQPAIPSVRFSTKLEAVKVLAALTGEAYKRKYEPEQVDVPNSPEQHESVAAVRGQTPRA
jgi:hypothetical protein